MAALVQLVCLWLGVRAGEPLYRPITMPSLSVASSAAAAALSDEPLVEHGPPFQPSRPGGTLPDELPLRRLSHSFRRCYEQALRADPSITGRIRLRIHAEEGVLTVEIAESSVSDATLARCLADAVRRVRMSPMAAFTVELPVFFKPKDR